MSVYVRPRAALTMTVEVPASTWQLQKRGAGKELCVAGRMWVRMLPTRSVPPNPAPGRSPCLRLAGSAKCDALPATLLGMPRAAAGPHAHTTNRSVRICMLVAGDVRRSTGKRSPGQSAATRASVRSISSGSKPCFSQPSLDCRLELGKVRFESVATSSNDDVRGRIELDGPSSLAH